jgi:hypothetical protein
MYPLLDIKELKYGKETYTSIVKIKEILEKEGFIWLLKSETHDAVIEIKNKTIIWKEGIFQSGVWKYGIFQNGGFYGNWINGIWEDGYFKGKGERLIMTS